MAPYKRKSPAGLQITADYDPAKMVWIPNTTTFISIGQELNGKTIRDAIQTALDNDLSVADTSLFIPHLIGVVSGNEILDGYGKLLSRKQRSTLYEQRLNDCWIALAQNYTSIDQHLHPETNYHLGGNQAGLSNGKLQSTIRPLERCLMEDEVLVDLNARSFNSQGLPIKKSRQQEYHQGRNMFFISQERIVSRTLALALMGSSWLAAVALRPQIPP